MCENKEFAMDKQELADDMLEQVAGGTAPDWAAGYNVGMVVDLTSLTVNGCCRKNRCQQKKNNVHYHNVFVLFKAFFKKF